MHQNAILPFASAVLALAPLAAQRPDATLDWQKRATTITYGAVASGKHHLGELAIGQSWRLGQNEASTWRVGMPLLLGEQWLAPGAYRVAFHRSDETTGALVADGSGHALVGGADARMTGAIEPAAKETKRLQIEWQKDGKPEAGNQAARVVVQFGASQWRGTALVLGHTEHKVPGGRLLAFHVPAARIDQGAVPIATLALGKDDAQAFNLILDGTTARLVPWMQAPTDSFGFGKVTPPDAAQVREGKATELEPSPGEPPAVLKVREATLQKGELRVVAACGSKAIEVVVPAPKAAK
jgi:hypothetical protein